eukprot:gene14215-18006_t
MAPHVAVPGRYQWRNAGGALLLELTWNGNGLSGFPNSYVFSQPQLEAVLNAKAKTRSNITVLRGKAAKTIRQDDDSVYLRIEPFPGPGDGQDICARYLVGADGANSVVRTQIDGTLQDLGFSAEWLVVDVLPAGPNTKLPVDDDIMLQVCDPRRPTTVVSGGPGRRRWEFMALEGETLEDMNNVDTAWALLKPWNITPDNAVLERHAIYRFRGAIADRWRH